jgi:hypothetical protein
MREMKNIKENHRERHRGRRKCIKNNIFMVS